MQLQLVRHVGRESVFRAEDMKATALLLVHEAKNNQSDPDLTLLLGEIDEHERTSGALRFLLLLLLLLLL